MIKTFETYNNGITFKEWLKNNPQGINTTSINCSNSNLIDLNGIEQFINLKYLYCRSNNLTELPDLSKLTNLRELNCYNNKLPYTNLKEYLEWYKKTYPHIYLAKQYNL